MCLCVYYLLNCKQPRNPALSSIPLALILARGDQLYVSRKPLNRRDKGDTLSLLVQLLLQPWVPCINPPASLLFSRLSGLLAATGPTFSFQTFFPLSIQVSPFYHMASTALVRFLALLRLSSALPDPIVYMLLTLTDRTPTIPRLYALFVANTILSM